jgi:hypothetical protein
MSLESTKTSRPSPTMVGVALLVIVASMAVAWEGVMRLIECYGRPELGSAIRIVAGTVIGGGQFLGMFRRQAWALLCVIVGLVGAGCLSLLAAVGFFCVGLVFGGVGEVIIICGAIAIAGGAALGCASVNLQWHHRLLADRARPLPLWPFSFRELLFAVTLLAVLLVLSCMRLGTPFEKKTWAVNVHPTAAPFDVPLNARDVCHGRNGRNRNFVAVEFTISEPEFVAWVEKRGKEKHYRWRTPLAPITSRYEVVTYRWLRGDDATQGLAVVNNGLFLELDDGYGSLQVAYDRDHSRAYACEDIRFGYRPPEEP